MIEFVIKSDEGYWSNDSGWLSHIDAADGYFEKDFHESWFHLPIGRNVRLVSKDTMTNGIIKQFEKIADAYELNGAECSVCDECERTYPMDWIIDGVCPFCFKQHTYDKWISLETYPIWNNRLGEEPEDFQDTHIMEFDVTPEELREALMETDWHYDWFVENWTWDMAKIIYDIIVKTHTPYGGVAVVPR